jgi:predicted dinucleotide-binding enzyme
MTMKYGILGSGEVAQSLAHGLLTVGHQVMLGTSQPIKLDEWQKSHPDAQVGSFSQTADFAEVLILAVRGSAAEDTLRTAGTEKLACKVIMDATNPIAMSGMPPKDGVLSFFTPANSSLMEQLQAQFPQARFVKVFNSVGHAYMFRPQFPGGKPTMFLCGNDPAAKTLTKELLQQFGWEGEDMGSAASARAIEPLCMLWCLRGFLFNRWDHAFKLLKEEA